MTTLNSTLGPRSAEFREALGSMTEKLSGIEGEITAASVGGGEKKELSAVAAAIVRCNRAVSAPPPAGGGWTTDSTALG